MSTNFGSITASTPAPLQPLQSQTITVQFNEMSPVPLRYELTDWNSGTIDAEGVYTAPDREGSFEIRITCPSYPQISTYAYITVQK